MSFLCKKYLNNSLGKQVLKVYYLQNQILQLRSLKTTKTILNKEKPGAPERTEATKHPKKQKPLVVITLLQNEKMTVLGLEEAKNLAKRRSLHLVKVQDMDTKNQRPVYKLLTPAELLQNELSEITNVNKSEKSTVVNKKAEKSLNINTRIGDHDLNARLKNITKWLSKQHEVRVLLQASSQQDAGKSEKVFKAIEDTIKTPQVIGKIVQKRNKGSITKFSILPVAPAIDDKSANDSQ